MDNRLLPAANKYLSNNERLLRYDRVKITDAILNTFEKLPEKANNFDYVAVDMNGDGTYVLISDNLRKSGPTDVIVATAGHETDHALRHSLIGRLGAGRTRYETNAWQVLGPLSIEELEEAIRCKMGREKYVSPETNYAEYHENYLEKKPERLKRLQLMNLKVTPKIITFSQLLAICSIK